MSSKANYQTVFKQMEQLRLRIARFRRVALHLHSPQSPREFATELKQYLDLVAITDHMRCGFASRVSDAHCGPGDFVVLPGIEENFRPEAALWKTTLRRRKKHVHELSIWAVEPSE